MKPFFAILTIGMLFLLGGSFAATATDVVYVSGQVTDAHGQPLSNALVAVFNDRNQVVDYAHTDDNGNYILALPVSALHLPQHHSQTFLAQVFDTAGHLVGGLLDFIANPLRAGVHAAAAGVAATTPNPLAKGGIAVGAGVVDQTLFALSTDKQTSVQQQHDRKQPGILILKAIAPGYKDLAGPTSIYWMEEDTFHVAGRTQKATVAWVDPVQLASLNAKEPSHAESNYLTFTQARLSPSLAAYGQTVRIEAFLPTPSVPKVAIVVVARDNRNGLIWQLYPKGDGWYEGEFTIDKRFPVNDQTISVLAYGADEQHPGRRPDVERSILRAGLWDPKEPFLYNPLLVCSRNRADLTLTVLPPTRP
ncbi:Carboxypeptidase regulatory-like domain [Chthonomonas calidirosea]|uniref:carboxypeptidase-like regulatory domain-containing protein n=1 Tax=Chthonomonas calidirosea TaxID=454171 RepID=UPI0006DD432E|nr:carboxypeptidase-like regulatory domain-containing protein [Chthonomonas calidirosea]CEK15044.1 Carboxypeptidase regulatory-like domain [Chthonomonas calidirosea]